MPTTIGIVTTLWMTAVLCAEPTYDSAYHWPLTHNAAEATGKIADPKIAQVTFEKDQQGYANFANPGAFLEWKLASGAALLGGDFTMELSVWTEESAEGGDLLSVEGGEGRGVSLAIMTRTGVTSSRASDRQLVFSVHDGKNVPWVDRGRPGRAIYVHAICAHEGSLFAGVCQPGEGEAGEVFRLTKEGSWESVGRLDGSNAVTALASWRGKLYAGTGKYRLAGSALTESTNTERGGRLFRWEGDDRWERLGELPDTDAVGGMAVYQDELLVSSLYRPARLYALDKQDAWKEKPLPEAERRVESMGIFEGALFATSYDNGHVYRFDGTAWSDTGAVGDNTQTYGFAIHRGELYVSTWPSGKVFRYRRDGGWEDAGRLGEELEVMGMAVFNGQLFAGTLPLADVYRYLGGTTWERSGNVDATADVKYRRAWTMAVYDGELYVGTLPSGHVHSTNARQCVTYDRPIPAGWRHVTARRDRDGLTIFIDGTKAASRSTGAAVDLGPISAITLGKGSAASFQGKLRALTIHPRALSDDEIKDRANAKR